MNFRRVLTALALIAVFTALASAQVPVTQTMSCTVSAATTPTVRAEGKTELVGNLLITCTGGPTPTQGAQLSRTDITVDFGAPVTSKVSAGLSEILLTIDTPGGTSTVTPGFGPGAAVSVCNPEDITTGCTSYANDLSAGSSSVWVMTSAPFATGTSAADGAVTAANVYVGVVGTGDNKNKVTFYGVPVLPVANVSFQRVYTIENVRVTPGSVANITATASVKPKTGALTGLTLSNASASVATSQTSLTTSLNSTRGASLCVAQALSPNANQGMANVTLLSFKENFATAFKANENGIAVAGVPVSAAANSPTRLKAVFANVPANVTLYVSARPVTDFATAPADASSPMARLLAVQGVAGEIDTAGDYADPAGVLANQSVALGTAGIPVVPVTMTDSRTGEVIWEVTAAAADKVDTLNFAVYAVYNLTTPPATGSTATVVLGYAPTEIIATPATDAATWIPRFAAPSAAAQNFLTVLPCQTSLLFPYLTNYSGWNTGIAISNTGKDPFNTVGKTGDCTFNFYGTNAPTTSISFATAMAPGSTAANTLSGLGLLNFSGYGVAVCTFQYAHGFAFVNNTTETMGVGYLATVMEGSPTRGLLLTGESFGQ